MSNVNLHSRIHNGTSRAIVGLLASLPLWLITSATALPQSASDLATTHDWAKQKASDRKVRAAVLRAGPTSGDPCQSQFGRGPYDPLRCIEQRKREWIVLLRVARADALAAQTVKRTIPKIVEGLSAVEREWRSLSPSAKERRLVVRSEVVEAAKESGGGVERALQTIIDDPRRSQDTRATATITLAASRRRGGFRGLGDLLECLDCLCCCPENCPCCDYGWPRDILNGQRTLTPR